MSPRLIALVAMVFAGCNCNSKNGGGSVDGAGTCSKDCPSGEVCRYDACVPPPTPCTTNAECPGDQYCDVTASECLPWGVGPGGSNDMACKRDPEPGVFFPSAQCEWTQPPAGDPYPQHFNVLSSPMVGTFYQSGEFSSPSIVFTAYNYTDGGAESCSGSDPTNYYGIVRIIDGRTCAQQATIDQPRIIPSASVAIADLGGTPTPEIVAPRIQGGLVAWTLGPSGWTVMWETTSQFADALCDWAGPSIHDLDDDGLPEVLFYGAVYNGQTGATIDESISGTVDAVGQGYIPIVADLDGNGTVELVTGSTIYSWEPMARRWMAVQPLPGMNGFTAVADFGTYPQAGADDRATLDGVAEIAVVYAGVAKVFNRFGREVFTASLLATGANPVGYGGPPTIADFDGDGRVEFASAGASAYNVFDPDCQGTVDPMTCPSLRTDKIAWTQPSQDFSSNKTGSSVFDFDGDSRAEVVYGDECYTRVYDGPTGKVLYSRFRTSCTWYENPLVVDVDADYNAEIVSGSNTNCNVVCPALDPIFDGVQCLDDSDCPQATSCGRDQPTDALGRCRCTADADCGGDGFVCRDPIAGPSAAGQVCRASHPGLVNKASGVRVLADTVDRWVNTRTIWNQHAYAVTNVEENGHIPKTSQWARNWTQMGLNNFRQNSPGAGAIPGAIADLTVKFAKVTCAAKPTVTAQVCNRGTEPVGIGLPVSVYAAGSPPELRCSTTTTQRLFPGNCTDVSCDWDGPSGDGVVIVDDRGNGTGTSLECREDNNKLDIKVNCN
jgi:hypothetical protein